MSSSSDTPFADAVVIIKKHKPCDRFIPLCYTLSIISSPSCILFFSLLESAGSASVAFHLISPGSRNLFSQAILQSAAATNPWAMVTKKEGKLRAMRLAEVLKCPHDEVSVSGGGEILRQHDEKRVRRLQKQRGKVAHFERRPEKTERE